MPRKRIDSAGKSGKAMMPRRIVCRVVRIRHPGRESGASFATGRQANGGDLLTIAKRHPGERLDKIWEPLGKNLPFTVRIPTGEFTNGKAKLNRTACAGRIT
jgi:hypothetical protein